MSRFNPIRNLTPATLVQKIEQFKAGYLPEFARAWDAIEDRDDITKSCSIKRRGTLGGLPWEVVEFPEADKAASKAHTEALTYFWRHIEVTDALDKDLRGGFSALVEQMGAAIGAKYAAHEIIWRKTNEGLTATFQKAPLWFFENRRGRLRYLPIEGALDGVDLAPGAWMVTVGDGIGIANAVCFMFKTLPLRDWLIYCERHGMPLIHGKTDAKPNTDRWNAMKDIVRALASECSVVTNLNEIIEKIDTTAQGQLPQPVMVERMDRGIATLWRGADLSTMSAGQGQGQGASLQGEESDFLLTRDANWATETLRRYVDRYVIAYIFGEGVEPAAGIIVQQPKKEDTTQQIAIDTFFRDSNIEQSADDLRERYQRAKPAPKATEIVGKPQEQLDDGTGGPSRGKDEVAFANERLHTAIFSTLVKNTMRKTIPLQNKAMKPLVDEIERVLALPDQGAVQIGLRCIRANLPNYLQAINQDPATAPIIENGMAAALFNGIANGKVSRLAKLTGNEEQTGDGPIAVRVERAPRVKRTRFELSRDTDGQIVSFDKVEESK